MPSYWYQLEPRSDKYPELTQGILVVFSHRIYETIFFDDLSKRDKLENDWAKDTEHLFVRYRKYAIALENFQRIPDSFSLGSDWDGMAHDSFFSGNVIRFVDDCNVRIGTFYDYKMDPLNPKNKVKVIPFKDPLPSTVQ